ncbi:hypothetical protein SDRG_07091 [Saprolegnia diclina VS20]|uniref:MORN repeat-containing protein 3 n=1 Tax=Saprolegnia diclina (strain VS20) TaxID=1156394 RepID=T0QNH7_SAPDV|nr:hypothetical protein SDRG_07091 [Saprolegnia diclina VS20]EQC35380.1 hypothetical protein SDRG_07091 [Saprolegnia diclina VS20]|eukprot:XP_008611130.1 hypothetical protein SDRG_07091 [Saprolegnia diclina VS20]
MALLTDGKPKGSNPLWKSWDAKSTKAGPHHSVYWVKHSAAHASEDKYGNPNSHPTSRYTLAAKYNGDWANDKKAGYGTQVCANGNKYEGEWVDGKRHGKGTFWVKRHAKLRKQYSGDWAEDERHGLGVYYYEDGGKYEGFWTRGQRDGKGRMTYADGAVYEGRWAKNERSGMGTLHLPNGNHYEGYWMHDMKEGPGRFFYKNTNKIYEAEWQADTAKCGTYHDMDSEVVAPEHFELPELELASPESVLNDTITALRAQRLDDEATPSEAVFALPLDVQARIQEAFHAIDRAHKGTIRCVDLVQLLQQIEWDGLPNDEASIDGKVEGLLQELGVSYDTEITFPECVDILAILLEPEDDRS